MTAGTGNLALFYTACFCAGFLVCFPFGAASLEVFRLSFAGRRVQAFLVAAGAVLVSAAWALLSYTGVRRMMAIMESPRTEVFLFAAAAILIGWLAVRGIREPDGPAAGWGRDRGPSRATAGGAVIKGVGLGLVNPQTIASWVVILSLFRKAGIRIPPSDEGGLPFFLSAAAGYGTFYFLVIRLSLRLGFLRSPSSRAKLRKGVATLMFLLALLFAAAALRGALR